MPHVPQFALYFVLSPLLGLSTVHVMFRKGLNKCYVLLLREKGKQEELSCSHKSQINLRHQNSPIYHELPHTASFERVVTLSCLETVMGQRTLESLLDDPIWIRPATF